MYMGQTLNMAVRTKDYECQLVTEDVLTNDGTLNMDTATYEIYCQGGQEKEGIPTRIACIFFCDYSGIY